MRESEWNYRLNNKLKPRLRMVWKIEANSQNGVPDNYYLGNRALWMEAKMINELPKRDSTIIIPDCSKLQLDNLKTHHEAEHNAMVIVAVKKINGFKGAVGLPFFTPEEWVLGLSTETLKMRIMTYDQIADAIVRYCTTGFSIRASFADIYLRI